MFTLSKAAAIRDLVFRWRTVTAAGALAASWIAFTLGLIVGPTLAGA